MGSRSPPEGQFWGLSGHWKTLGVSAAMYASKEIIQSLIRWLYCVKCPQYSIRLKALGYLCTSWLLITSCIRRCLVSRGCDWVMSALSAVVFIYIFQFKSAFLARRSARRYSGVLGIPNIGHRASPKMESTCQTNDLELIPTVKIEPRHPVEGLVGSEFPSIYNQRGVVDAWGCKTLKIEKFLRFYKNVPFW